MANGKSPSVTLVPQSGVQFLVYGFDIEAAPKFSRSFLERPDIQKKRPDGTTPLVLLPTYNETDPDGEPPYSFDAKKGDYPYDINKLKAIEPFVDAWVPVPFLAVRPGVGDDGMPVLAQGPSNWCRARVAKASKSDTGFTHKLVLAFDTQLVAADQAAGYCGPTEEDSRNQQSFMLAHRFRDLSWFFSNQVTDPTSGQVSNMQQWAVDWVRELFYDLKRRAARGRPFRPEELEAKLEHIARYISFLEFISGFVAERVELVDTVSDEPFAKPVNVDLILDIGNSRTCGILIESFPGEDKVDLGNSMVLELRDLSRPDLVYSEPFESHVELAQADFGPEQISRTSGRVKAFFWPSLVRIGPEAARFQEEAEGTEAASGMSSPKRYLWDVAPVLQPWKFQPRDYDQMGLGPMIDRAARLLINPRGDVLSEVHAEAKLYQSLVAKAEAASLTEMGLRLTASRSSFFTFMVAEILAQALSMINNFQVRQQRKFTDSPRRLNRLILTLPTAMPVREQRIMRSRVSAAVKLVWDLMGWPQSGSERLRPPEVIVRWDEASCVQFVYLYTEIVEKLRFDVETFFNLAGRQRKLAEPDKAPAPGAETKPSLRVASIDVGGGTTDLMITTYYADSKYAIQPSQTFRESFRIAGDDILKSVIERAVLPRVEMRLRECGVPGARDFLNAKFGGNRANMSEQDKHLRQQFVLRFLRPIAIELLRAFEASDVDIQEATVAKTVAALVAEERITPPSDRIASYLAPPGAAGFSLNDVSIEYDYARINDAVTSVLDEIFNNIAEVLNHFDCDVVLLAGRPSRLPATVDLLVNKLSVPPDRIIPLHEYRVGAWYPFKTKDNVRISDPKTATVVGGLLCALAERKIMNLTIYTDRLTMKSTAKFIGQLDNNGKLRPENVLFSSDGTQAHEKADGQIRYDAPMRIGYRQLPFARWTANPLYTLSLQQGANVRTPITVDLSRGIPDEDVGFDDIFKLQAAEAQKEEISISDAQDRGNASVRRLMQLTLNTLGSDEGYWLDTGILNVD